MPNKTDSSAQRDRSQDQHPAGHWKASSAAGQDPATGAPIRRSAYGQTPQEAAGRLLDRIKANTRED